ncbi:MAG TPA: hypothetical protein VF855_12665 [Acidimicrobiales bacterium]
MRRLASIVLAVAVLVLAAAGGALAQTATTSPGTTAPDTTGPEPTVTLPPNASSTIPGGCPELPKPTVEFVGELTSKSDDLAEFAVREVRKGELEATTATVAIPDEGRFLRAGSLYLVAAIEDPESTELQSKVRPDRDQGEVPATCPPDQIRITNVDGTPIDTGVLSGMRGKWGRALFLILAPVGLAVGVLLAFVLAKRFVRAAARVPVNR